MRNDAALSVSDKHVLIAGNLLALSLLPVIQQANHMFSHVDVVSGVLRAQAIVALIMLVGKVRIRQQRIHQKANPARLMVRARWKIDLVNIFGPDVEIVEMPDADYRWRIFVDREELKQMLNSRITEGHQALCIDFDELGPANDIAGNRK